jgi:hypothetical protein
MFQSGAGQILLEYLLARADLLRDEYLEKEDSTDRDRAKLQGQLSEIDEIVGLVAFMDSFKELPNKL